MFTVPSWFFKESVWRKVVTRYLTIWSFMIGFLVTFLLVKITGVSNFDAKVGGMIVGMACVLLNLCFLNPPTNYDC
jgi:hypothetical protein